MGSMVELGKMEYDNSRQSISAPYVGAIANMGSKRHRHPTDMSESCMYGNGGMMWLSETNHKSYYQAQVYAQRIKCAALALMR